MIRRRAARLTLVSLIATIGSLAFAAPSMARDVVYGVTEGDALVTFDSDRPGTQTTVPLGAGFNPATEDIEAIDFRPATGGLYALIRIVASNTYEVRRIIPQNGSFADLPAPPVALTGSDFGFDFDPTVDRIRVHSDTGFNGRFSPNTGALTTDTALTDDGVTGTAYSQNVPRGLDGDLSAPATTQLYGIDVTEDRVVTMQSPPATFENVTDRGLLGVDAVGDVGFDISQRGDALAAIRVGAAGPVKLFRIERDLPDTSSPAAKEIGTISAAGAADKVHAIAIAPRLRNFATLLAPAAGDTRQRLGFFRADLPEGLVNVRPIIEADPARPTESLPAGVDLVGIDTRQRDGELYGVGNDSRLYELVYDEDPDEILVHQVSGTPFAPALAGSAFGTDFNPAADLLRLVSNTNQNLRVNPETGALVPGDAPLSETGVSGAAYTNPFEGARNTTLYGIDSNNALPGADTLVRIGDVDGTPNSPNTGITTTVGSLGAPLGFPINLGDDLGFDIEPENDLGYLAGQIPVTGSSDRFLLTVGGGNTVSEAVVVGRVGGQGSNTPTQGLAFLNNDLISLGSVTLLAPEDIGRLPIFVTRSGPAEVPASVRIAAIGVQGAGNPFDFTGPEQIPPGGTTPVPDNIVDFAPGETVKTVFLPIVNDNNAEDTELIAILLEEPVTGGAAIGFPHQTIVAIPANDQPTPTAANTTPGVINGTPGNDRLVGTPGNDLINCGAGDDIVDGGGGDDVIACGDGNDRVSGGAGDDRILGEAGNDVLSGGTGDDTISGGSGNDVINGGSGNDVLRGDSGNDRVSGNTGEDRITGGTGNDVLSGNEGDDRLAGNSGGDRISGNEGGDRASGGSGNDRMAGNSGNDILSGNSGRDSISGGTGDDRISGGAGNDKLSGNAGADRISGNSGADRIRGGSGVDRLSGGSGRDVVRQR